MSMSFRHSAGFGKRMEYKLIGDMLMEGLDCYVPLVDDHGVDCVIKKVMEHLLKFKLKHVLKKLPMEMLHSLQLLYTNTDLTFILCFILNVWRRCGLCLQKNSCKNVLPTKTERVRENEAYGLMEIR